MNWNKINEHLNKSKNNKVYYFEGKLFDTHEEIETKDLICCIEKYKTRKGEEKIKLNFRSKKILNQ
ncbi:MAG: hypothetical protein ACRCW9_06085 [Cetobacterium sp.]